LPVLIQQAARELNWAVPGRLPTPNF